MSSERKSSARRLILVVVALAVVAAASYGVWRTWIRKPKPREIRQALWAEIQPVALSNCTLKRYGSANDGGYLMCAELIKGVESVYSYGIDQEDNWGCALSEEYGVPVHQYDCFTNERPTCPKGTFVFHDECIGPRTETIDAQPFDTLAKQIEKNGDRGKRLIVKIDVEGAEWDSLLATPTEVLDKIDQLPMELHGVAEAKFVQLVKKLKQSFYLVSVHFNNWACAPKAKPLPAIAFQVLFVNKRLGTLDPGKPGHVPGSPPDAPDNPGAPDCQPVAAAN